MGGKKNHAFDFPPKQHSDRLRLDSASRTGKKISSFNQRVPVRLPQISLFPISTRIPRICPER